MRAPPLGGKELCDGLYELTSTGLAPATWTAIAVLFEECCFDINAEDVRKGQKPRKHVCELLLDLKAASLPYRPRQFSNLFYEPEVVFLYSSFPIPLEVSLFYKSLKLSNFHCSTLLSLGIKDLSSLPRRTPQPSGVFRPLNLTTT